MAMTDTERVLKRLKTLITVAHEVNYDFVYIPVGTAKLIVRLLEEKKHTCKICGVPMIDGSGGICWMCKIRMEERQNEKGMDRTAENSAET